MSGGRIPELIGISANLRLPVGDGRSVLVNGYDVRVRCPRCGREHTITTLGTRDELEASLTSGSECPRCEHQRKDR